VPYNLPTQIAAQLAWTPIEAWASTTAGATEYAARAAAGNRSPLDMAEDLAPTAAVPTLVLRPQAGHALSIVDYGRDQSQMMTLRDAGLDRLFTIDWLPATDDTAGWSIEEYVAVMEEAVQLPGGRVNLVGDCQGGWLAVVYAGLHPGQMNTLTIGGATD
jgi:poly(3-hydroxyalkanoate) synthetase